MHEREPLNWIMHEREPLNWIMHERYALHCKTDPNSGYAQGVRGDPKMNSPELLMHLATAPPSGPCLLELSTIDATRLTA
jgi:hypothetical protein